MTDDSAYLTIQNLAKHYPGTPKPSVVGVNLTLGKGRILALLGPSGCGKTTLLRMIAGFTTPNSGRLMAGGEDMRSVPLHQRNIGMVFQSYALFPHMTVAENIAFGLEMRRLSRTECRSKVDQMLALTHLDNLAKRRINTLSGGQQQRVALARALVIEPKLLLLDEPLANLDVKLRKAMGAEIRTLQRRLGITVIFVTHDQDEALSIADDIAVMSAGTIQQKGSPSDIYDRPVNRFVAEFVGRGNFLEAAWSSTGPVLEAFGACSFPDIAPWSGTRTVMIRPHRIRIVPDGSNTVSEPLNLCKGTITEVVYMGESRSYTVSVGDKEIIVDQMALTGETPQTGQTVQLGWRPQDLTILEAEHL